MLRSGVDTARHADGLVEQNVECEVALRSFQDGDFSELCRLFYEGVLSEVVTPADPATDLQALRTRFLSRPQDHLWVAEARQIVIASIGLTEDKSGIGHIRRLRVDHVWRSWRDGDVIRMLVAKAAEHARQHELLKLVIHTPLHDERAIGFLHQIGFQFARVRDEAGEHLLEFYLNIYDPPIHQRPHHS